MYTAPQGTSLASSNRHKSMTSTATLNGRTNKKRSSYLGSSSASTSAQHRSALSSMDGGGGSNNKNNNNNNNNNPLNGFGRLASPSKRTTGSIQASALTMSGSAPSATSLAKSGLVSGLGGRLQAYQQDAPAAAGVTASAPFKGGISNNGIQTDGSFENSNQFNGNSNEGDDYAYTPPASPYSAPAAPVMGSMVNATMIMRRRPVARSIRGTYMYKKDDLLYAEESPDFCSPNPKYNIKGTRGRSCSESHHASNSCEKLCCGRGYKTEIREEDYPCECDFKFCCTLNCKVCKRPKTIHKCL